VVFSGPGKQPTLKERNTKQTLAKAQKDTQQKKSRETHLAGSCEQIYIERERTPPGKASNSCLER
jgi:hypothetical protein